MIASPESNRWEALLAKHGFVLQRDEAIPGIAAAHGIELAGRTRFLSHLRIATADRTAS